LRISHKRKEALERLIELLSEIHNYVDVIIVEGLRDADSLRSLGCQADIEILSHVGVSDFDLAEQIASKYNHVLILTDFDEEGLSLNQRFSSILERKGVIVETGLRRRIANLMAMIGVYAIESLDNIRDEIK
jgi:5S rRNA maturation endonuclease (ribonuclease M5)